MTQSYDIIIIGSGPGGYRAAVLGALRNLKIAIVEKHLWGGCCLNRGCVPKKAWHHTATLLQQMDKLKTTGFDGEVTPNFQKAWQHQQSVSATVRENYQNYMKRLGITAFEGHARLDSPTRIVVDSGAQQTILEAKQIILATGSTPLLPENIVSSKRLISTDKLFEFDPPPGDKVALIGGGVIAVEMAFILTKLGKQVQWYSRSPILQRNSFSEQAKAVLEEAFHNAHIALPEQRLPTNYLEAEQVTLSFDDNNEQTVDWVLFATGRKPHTDLLGLEHCNILLDDSGFIQTNEFLQTNEENIYAIGDVRSPVMTANQAIADANVVIENILQNNSLREKIHEVPQAIYSCVEMAKVGLSEAQAEEEDYEPATGFTAFESSPTALGQNDTEGFLRIIADMDSGKFLGGEIVGKNAGELIHLMTQHQESIDSLSQFANLIINHPSRSEEIVNATETLANKWNMQEFIFSR